MLLGAIGLAGLAGFGAWVGTRQGQLGQPRRLASLRVSLEPGTGVADDRGRTAVIPLDVLPFTVERVHGPGDVTLSNSLLDGFRARHAEVETVTAYVSTTGDDRTAAVDDPARTFRTIPAALASAGTVVVDDGEYPPFEHDTGFAIVRARNPGKVTITQPSGIAHRVARLDQLDRDGFPVRLPVGTALQPNMRAYYHDAKGNAHVRVLGGALCLDGIDFAGISVEANGGQAWVSNFTSFAAYGHAFHTTGGEIYLERGRIHAAMFDGWNCDWKNERGTIAAAGVEVTESGDFATYGNGAAYNRQAGSSHSGYLAAFGCVARRNMGQEFADTSVVGVPNLSWYVACIAGDDAYSGRDAGLGFSFIGHGVGGREAYLDTCRTESVPIPMYAENGAKAYTFDCQFTGGLPYDPEDPDSGPRDEAMRRDVEAGI